MEFHNQSTSKVWCRFANRAVISLPPSANIKKYSQQQKDDILARLDSLNQIQEKISVQLDSLQQRAIELRKERQKGDLLNTVAIVVILFIAFQLILRRLRRKKASA